MLTSSAALMHKTIGSYLGRYMDATHSGLMATRHLQLPTRNP